MAACVPPLILPDLTLGAVGPDTTVEYVRRVSAAPPPTLGIISPLVTVLALESQTLSKSSCMEMNSLVSYTVGTVCREPRV